MLSDCFETLIYPAWCTAKDVINRCRIFWSCKPAVAEEPGFCIPGLQTVHQSEKNSLQPAAFHCPFGVLVAALPFCHCPTPQQWEQHSIGAENLPRWWKRTTRCWWRQRPTTAGSSRPGWPMFCERRRTCPTLLPKMRESQTCILPWDLTMYMGEVFFRISSTGHGLECRGPAPQMNTSAMA